MGIAFTDPRFRSALPSIRPVGYLLLCIAKAVNLNYVPQVYITAVEALKRGRRIHALYTAPPTHKRHAVSEYHRRGLYVKVPLDQRLVDVEDDPFEHLKKAARLSANTEPVTRFAAPTAQPTPPMLLAAPPGTPPSSTTRPRRSAA